MKLSIKVSNFEKQEDSFWLMARWTGGNERFVRLWDKGKGWRGKLSCQGGRKKMIKRHGYMEWYKGKKTCRKLFLICLNVYVFYLLSVSGLMHNTSKGTG